MKEHHKRPLHSRIVLRIIKYLFRLVLAAIILAAAVLATIQTPPGKRLLARGLTSLASTPGTPITFRGISGVIPFRVRLGELRLGDPEGDWLVIEGARVRLDPFELLSLRLHAETVTVERVSWYRLPVSGGEEAENDSDSFIPAEIPSFAVDRLLVRKVIASESLLGHRLEASLEGAVSNSVTAGPRAELLLSPLWRAGEGLSISGDSAADLSRLRLELKLEEDAGGTLGGILFPGDPGPLSFRFRAAGPWERVETGVALQAPGRFEVEGDIAVDLSSFLVEGELNAGLTRPPLPGWEGAGDLSVRLAGRDGGQDLALEAGIRDLSAPGLRVQRGAVRSDLTDLHRSARGETVVEVEDVNLPPPEEFDPDVGDLFRSLTGRLVIGEEGGSPRANLELLIRGFTAPGLLLDPGERRDLALTGNLTGDRLELDLEGSGEHGFRLEAGLAAGVRFSTGPLSLEFPPEGDLRGSLSAGIDLTFLNNLLALTRQTLGGRAEIELGLNGTWEHPAPGGRVLVSGAEYQNLNSGTVLHNVVASLLIDEDRLILEEFTARTPRPSRPLLLGWTRFIPGVRYTPLADSDRDITAAGRISLSGSTRLSPAEGYPSIYTLRLEDALLADMELATVIAAGEVTYEGSMNKSLLSGRVKLRHAEGRIPPAGVAAVPEIEVIEVNKPGEEEERPPSRPSPFLENMALDLELTARNNVIVRGRGLDSEWRADVRVSGTASRPEIRGGLTLLAGIFVFMGEEMRLEDSSVMMDGEYPPNPHITINARIVKSDIVMNLQVVGPVTDPEVLITSQPPYPDDEILARLLFGRPVSQLSGLQALQIANGLRVIRGEAGFFDLLTGLTSFLGTIQVDFTDLEGAEDHSAVRIRWSLSRNFYIENQHSIDSPDNLFVARWEIIRNLQLRVQSGYGMLGDAAFLQWKMDYR